MNEPKLRVGISQGDVNGIGLEVIMKTFSDMRMLEICTPVLFSSHKTIQQYRKIVPIEEFNYQTIRELSALQSKKVNVYNVYEDDVLLEPGMSTEQGGKLAYLSLQAACNALKNNQIDVLVTAPINKHNIQSEQFKFIGHTEYLGEQFGPSKPLMIMVANDLRVGLVTGHIPLSDVSTAISADKIIASAHALNTSLQIDFGIRKPKIAVLGLNPHAGDNGALGKEEIDIIIPALETLRNEQNVLAYGPFAADGLFGSSAYQNYDAVLAMYHDQGLAPFKSMAFHAGVNFTAGLPIVRTSPDHGTAYDLFGKNLASEESFRQAVYQAIDIFKARALYAEISSNPLKITPIKRERA